VPETKVATQSGAAKHSESARFKVLQLVGFAPVHRVSLPPCTAVVYGLPRAPNSQHAAETSDSQRVAAIMLMWSAARVSSPRGS